MTCKSASTNVANLFISLLKGIDPKDGIPYEKKFCEGINYKTVPYYNRSSFLVESNERGKKYIHILM